MTNHHYISKQLIDLFNLGKTTYLESFHDDFNHCMGK